MPRFLIWLERLTSYLRYGASLVVIILFCVMMSAVLVQIGGRYIFNYSISAATELATFSQIWLVLLGAGVAMARKQHVAIDILPAMFSLNVRRAASLIIAIVTMTFLAVLAYGTLPLLRIGTIQTSPAMQIPMWIAYLCLPAGSIYIAFELVVSTVKNWNDPFRMDDHNDEEAA